MRIDYVQIINITINVIRDYQTLIAGIVATIAAYYTINAVRDQIKQDKTINDDRLNRSAKAARALLPLSLNIISNYCYDVVRWLESGIVNSQDDVLKFNRDAPKYNEICISMLKEAVETSEPSDAERLSEIPAMLQIISANVSSMNPDLINNGFEFKTKRDAENLIDRIACLYSKIDLIYPYSRNDRKDFFEVPLANKTSALFCLRVSDGNFPNLFK